MTAEDGLIWLFCVVDERLGGQRKHSQARLWPSELVTNGLLFALTGSAFRSFYTVAGSGRCGSLWRPA